MPELPEVETVVRHVRKVLRGTSFLNLEVRWKNSFWITSKESGLQQIPVPQRVRAAHEILLNRHVRDVTRRGKWIVISFSDTPAQLGIHLRMTGRIRFFRHASEIGTYDRVVIRWSPQVLMTLQDMRKFGKIILDPFGQGPWVSLGLEPLEPSFVAQFPVCLQGHRGTIKPLLLNQRIIAGVGNIYADESLFLSGIHPRRKASSLTHSERERLTVAIPKILTLALMRGGSTIRDYRNAQNKKGTFQSRLHVYGRAGMPCLRCKGQIERIVISQRGTYFCPGCQH